jgi:hypothetical protein
MLPFIVNAQARASGLAVREKKADAGDQGRLRPIAG